jgi:hypothetical protein
MNRIAIMQPYFLPYIGYFQLIAAADQFIVYDNIKYTKKGWINRNRMLRNGVATTFSLPLKQGTDTMHVRERELACAFRPKKLMNQFCEAYLHSPYFRETLPLLEEIIFFNHSNLFQFIHHSITLVCESLGIQTDILASSCIPIDHTLKGQEKVIALCKALGATTYINPSGGVELYDHAEFMSAGIELKFIKPDPFEYPQPGNAFEPWLSIIDPLMYCQRPHLISAVHQGYTFFSSQIRS